MLLARALDRLIDRGTLDVVDPRGRRYRTGGRASGPAATIRVHDSASARRLLLNPRLAVGESYMNGTLTVVEGSLYDFLEIICSNISAIEDTPLVRLSYRLQALTRLLEQFNPIGRSARNVAHHYDLSAALYDLFLDRDRQYSCAYFAEPGTSLERAQEDKKLHLLAKLLVEPQHRVLDIGSGWGGLGLSIARMTGADVTGLTLSREQHKAATLRAEQAGLSGRLRFELEDYRRARGRFDRIVSVGMFEHVGTAHYREFFAKVKSLLADEGLMLLHSIGRMEPPGGTNPWLRKYIFPGGYTPALSEVLAAVENAGLWVLDIEILRLHYAETLRHWRLRFAANRERIKSLAGYDERFCRMWEFYLTACELSFRYLRQMVFQMQIAHRQDVTPLTRDYIGEYERLARTPQAPSAAAS